MGVVVPFGSEDAGGDRAFAALRDLVADEMAHTNDFILSRMQSQVRMIPELAGHLIKSGGKRLRPLLTLAAIRMCGYRGDDNVRLAASVEFLHTATLLHDDVVDESGLRRGLSTANAIWGNQASVLVGDFLLSRAFQLMVEIGSLRILEILSNAAGIIVEGEVLQLERASDIATTEDTYLRIITAKTATLFAAACQTAAVIATRPPEEEEALESYGKNLGIAFQLVDDALDYSARQASFGKTVGDDFREGKITLPVVLSFRRGSDTERAFWRRVMEEGQQNADDLAMAVQLMNRHGALSDTIERARHYGDMARDALAIFPESAEKTCLLGIVDFCISRAH
ncbi:MAG TPA: polyprenyl synthetase family protein [Alphaproteobacteria bacterium]|nr:polyprenyl synthetase family protein [Alphaproteobacteria bacterium]